MFFLDVCGNREKQNVKPPIQFIKAAFEIQKLSASAKKLLKTQQKLLYITSAMASAYPGILARAKIWFYNGWDYLFCLNYIVY